ncbi:MAG: FKBP-type peptidyl-prolyl cis-trans isomerase [Alphaproteobacteria bacterium]|nr:FKBP-type peptidyl-prolyl cis-trans isomerase [Alphaproteobacteria bacterium]
MALLLLATLACAPKAPPSSGPPPQRSFFEGPPPDAAVTPSGLAYQVLRPGTGVEHPGPRSTVTVHYTGWTADGRRFDSSYGRGEPATFGLDQVIPGWTEGVQLMVVGEQTRFWIPPDLAYGYNSSGPTGQLVFDVELLAIVQ